MRGHHQSASDLRPPVWSAVVLVAFAVWISLGVLAAGPAGAATTRSHHYGAADTGTQQIVGAAARVDRPVGRSAAPPAAASGYVYDDTAQPALRSAPPVAGFLAPQTPGGECEPGGFWRGSRPGQPVSFEPMPNEYRVDATTGFVKPTHGVSVFDNPESVVSKGFEPHRIDLTSIPSDLQIIQRGNDPHHYEITPRSGTSLLPEEYAALLRRIRTLG